MAEAKEAKRPAAVVTWSAANTFESRSMRHQDWQRLGASAEPVTETVTWDQDNAWTVPRSSVPLDDEQLAAFLAREPKFSVREV